MWKRSREAALVAGTGLFMVACALKYRGDDATWLVALGVGLALLQGAVLPLRRARPALTAAVALAAAAGLQLLHSEIVLPIGAYVAVGALALRRPPRASWWGLAGLAALALAAGAGGDAGDVIFLLGVAAAAWGTGELRRVRAVRHQEASRAAVAQEQARIARELHDVIAHSVSVIVVQATAADHVFDERPDRARAALRAIEATGRETLAELRRLLPALRPFDDDGDDAAGASLARLDELVARVRATGLAVTVRRDGRPAPLPAPVDLSAFRIVQEALTNTLRHAGATHAEVALRWEPTALELDVRDDGCGTAGGPRAARAGDGRGTSGMRERAELLGGTLEAGPGPDGGYRVHARLPLETAA